MHNQYTIRQLKGTVRLYFKCAELIQIHSSDYTILNPAIGFMYVQHDSELYKLCFHKQSC